jgi:hypothetical protein
VSEARSASVVFVVQLLSKTGFTLLSYSVAHGLYVLINAL